MKLGSKGRYAVMAMVDLGVHGRDRTVSLAEIAERQEISLSYLEQLFSKLRRGGLVSSVRGPGGGYRLARRVGDITILEVVDAVDESLRVTRCKEEASPTEGCMQNRSRCLTHDLWEDLGDHIRSFLHDVSLEDVCERRLCPARADLLAAE
ncbi:MAG: Rrf2 family transcriptional regulator [Rhodospirillaceae bacterium]|nr:Rrf2 family transcriptional regulator [Rhodospirillaceae bacterium]|tara:strand:+ start:14165 stop:14617 length:453 start_codon:yes stop_codon:yes gene_type:complete